MTDFDETFIAEQVLSDEQFEQSARYLASLQTASGQIPWFPGGHCDPWNHVESLMALTATGLHAEARAAFGWLRDVQRRDGSWFNYYLGEWVSQRRIDLNVCAYVATGLFHYLRATDDVAFVAEQWPWVERAIDFILRYQRADGTFPWCIDERGVPATEALLTGCSSILMSLRCAAAVADRLDASRPDVELAAGRLQHAIECHPALFAPKPAFAMDWYYPMLTGALVKWPGMRWLNEDFEEFSVGGFGIRCVRPNNWTTVAETSEFILTIDALGSTGTAKEWFEVTHQYRRADGAYFTGIVFPELVTYPRDEVSSYSVAAVLLAADALSRRSAAHDLFHRGVVPRAIDVPEPYCTSQVPVD